MSFKGNPVQDGRETMTRRERFCRLYDFEKTDRSVWWEAVEFWPETVEQWRSKGGLPAEANVMQYYGFDPTPRVYGGLGCTALTLSGPPVQSHVLKEEQGTRVMENDLGAIWRIRTDGASMPQWLKFPIESHQDWLDKIKPRLDPCDHDFSCLDQETALCLEQDGPIGFWITGLYAFWRLFWGEVNLAYAFYDYPETLHDMARTWLKLHCECHPRIFSTVQVDYMLLHEDMAYKNGPLIGPALFDEFIAPYYRELMAHLRQCGQHRFMLDSDGNNGIVLERFAELGINGLFPFEAAAGCDALEFRRKYPRFVVWGAIDKRVLLRTKEDIEREVMSKVPPLWEGGGFIPSIDHSVPPCPQENFEYFLQLVREICR